jgi:hypothetical protein
MHPTMKYTLDPIEAHSISLLISKINYCFLFCRQFPLEIRCYRIPNCSMTVVRLGWLRIISVDTEPLIKKIKRGGL